MKFRSQYESDFYDFLKTLPIIKEIIYEPDTFSIPYGYKLFFKYTPDFKIRLSNGKLIFIELKGWNPRNRNLFMFKKKILYSYFDIVLCMTFYVVTSKSKNKFYVWGNRLTYHDKYLLVNYLNKALESK